MHKNMSKVDGNIPKETKQIFSGNAREWKIKLKFKVDFVRLKTRNILKRWTVSM